MQIRFEPMRRDDRLELSREGDTLTINGEAFNFSGVIDGATLPREAVACDWLASDIERIGGVLHMTLVLPHGANATEATRFPDQLTLTADGPVTLPDYDAPTSELQDHETILQAELLAEAQAMATNEAAEEETQE